MELFFEYVAGGDIGVGAGRRVPTVDVRPALRGEFSVGQFYSFEYGV